MNLFNLTITNPGITLDLDKDWYSDLNEHPDTIIEMFFLFFHV